MRNEIRRLMRYTYLIYVLSAAVNIAAFVSCNGVSESEPAADAEQTGSAADMVEVSLRMPSLSTRTSIGEDNGKTLVPKWDDGDEFGLLIRNTDGSAAVFDTQSEKLSEPFEFVYRPSAHDLRNVIFTGLVPRMSEGEYLYAAIYPKPSAGDIDGTTVRMSIPSVQTGEYDGGCDLMFARAVGDRLDPNLYNDLDDFEFEHLTHALKIHLPENVFGGKEVSDMRINFPRAVAGDLSLDIVTGATTFSGDETGITVHFAEPTTGGRDCWVYIKPGNMTDGQVSFMVTDGTEYSFPLTSDDGDFGDLKKQHITPVSLSAMKIRPRQEFKITVDYEQLGEPVRRLTTFTLGDYVFPGMDMPTVLENVQAREFIQNGSQTVTEFLIDMFVDEAERFASSGTTLLSEGIALESDNTYNLLGDLRPDRGGFNVKDLSANGFTINAPYLFFEDFSGVTKQEYGNSASWFTSSGLDGWSGSSVTINAGGYLDISTYIGTTAGNTGNRWGRCDSPTMSRVRDNIQVALTISYNIDGSEVRNAVTGRVQSRCIFGYHENNTAISGGSGNNPVKPANIVEEYNTNTNSYSNSMPEKTHTIQAGTKQTRFTWFEDYTRLSGAPSTVTPHMYIDNIRVSIAQ